MTSHGARGSTNRLAHELTRMRRGNRTGLDDLQIAILVNSSVPANAREKQAATLADPRGTPQIRTVMRSPVWAVRGDLLLVAVVGIDRPSDRDDRDFAGTRSSRDAVLVLSRVMDRDWREVRRLRAEALRYCQYLWTSEFQATSAPVLSGSTAPVLGLMSVGRSSSLPLWNTAPARTSATRCGALTARQRAWAASISL